MQHLAFEGGFNQSFESVKFPQRPLIAIHVWWAKKGWRQESEEPRVGEARKYVGENQCVKAGTFSPSVSIFLSLNFYVCMYVCLKIEDRVFADTVQERI